MNKILSILCIAAAFVFASKTMADEVVVHDGTYGIHYNNTGPTTWIPGDRYYENPVTKERSSTWKSGWTWVEVPGHNEVQSIGAWHLNQTGEAYNALRDSSLSLSIERNNTASGFSYGTFKYDSVTGKIVADSEEYIGSVEKGKLGSGVSIPYKANDLVGVWVEYEVEKEDGVKQVVRYYSQDSENKGDKHTETHQTGDPVKPPEGYAALWFDDRTGWPGGQPGAPIKILVTGVAPASTGAPLPGVLATVALCSAVGGYLRRKKSAARIDQE